MKTAEEWMKDKTTFRDENGNDVRLVDALRIIQLDAYRQGMTDATEEIENGPRGCECGNMNAEEVKNRILAARSKKTLL